MHLFQLNKKLFSKKVFHDFFLMRQAKYLIVTYALITLAIFCHAFILYYFDSQKGGGEYTFFDFVWCGYTTASTTGYGDISASTTPSRIATIIIMYHLVIGLFTWFISAVIDTMLTYKERRQKGMHTSPLKDGIVIFQYPGVEKMVTFIQEFRRIEDNVPICIVDPDLEELPMELHDYGKLHFVKQRLLSKKALDQSNIKEAKWIFIFPQNLNNSDSDALTLAIYQNLMTVPFTHQNVRIIPWLISAENQECFSSRGNSVVMGDLQVKLMVQEATDRHVGVAVDTLLKNTEDANPISIAAGKLTGKTWGQLQYGIWKFNENREKQETINLLALVKQNIPYWTLPNDKKVEKDDQIIVASFPHCCWNDVEEKVLDLIETSSIE